MSAKAFDGKYSDVNTEEKATVSHAIIDWFKITGWVTVICGFWVFGPAVFIGMSAYLFYVKFNLALAVLAIYLCWYYYTRDWPESGCMPMDWVRDGFFYRWECEYFNYRVVKTAELPADRNYIIGSHPHGMICLGMAISFVAHASGMRELYPGLKRWTATIPGQFLWPVRREMMMCGGSGIVSKRNLEWILRQKETGQAVTIVVGGLSEMMMTAPGKHRLKLKHRHGFIKLALAEGANLVPMYHFGENDTYTPVTGICPNRLRNMQAHLTNRFGFCFPCHVGSSLLGLPWGGLVPHRVRLETVIGAPIHVEKNANPTQEEIDGLHATYCEKLIDIFEKHKTNYGIGPEERIVLVLHKFDRNDNECDPIVLKSLIIMIAQIRNNLLLDSQVEYNCSAFDPTFDWSTKGARQPIFGGICVLCGIVCIIPYLFCLVIMWRKRSVACYKMMFFLGVNDVFLLIIVCFFAGAIFATGGVFCHNPKLHFIVCMLAFVGFFASCSTCFLIALNRVIEMLHINQLAWLYEGNRPWYGMLAPIGLGVFAALCTPIAFFNSDQHIVHFDPMISNKYEYANVLHAANNIFFPMASFLLYTIMILRVRATTRKTTSRDLVRSAVNRAALVISVQCGVIVCVHMSTCVGYLALQFIPSSDILRYTAHLGWILLHGLPPFVYLAFNRSMRRSFVLMTNPASRVTTNTGPG
ncbi:hypothetical protein PRIPAC_79066 [Pristionchus pacificus]|uniref:diacylglycerol O-acyltransferase n=1 Tax=Pristionchus pacificus TaxID=54126 RepID=A0A2A6CMP0_PRIPA|nr:hypothetical protein PRIPAC_79066 [Pristionchus pacificus]|eukprot:PDM79379.1 G protein-coupled receptor [Pristionchus pacificus]